MSQNSYPTYAECVAKFPKKKVLPFVLSEDGKMLFNINPKIKGALIVPEGVEEVRFGALKATGLTAVVMPDSVREMKGYLNGSYCDKVEFIRLSPNMRLSNKCFDSTPMKSIVIPEGIEFIPANAFAHSKLKSVELPSTLKFICADAFKNSKLEEVVIPASVKLIFPGAFATDTLQKVTFESADTKVMPDAFTNMDYPDRRPSDETFGLDEVVYDEKDGKLNLAYLPPYYYGPLAVKEGTQSFEGRLYLTLDEYPGITELTIPESMRYNHLPKYLRKLTLADNVTELKLENQKQLQEFNWPASATNLRISESPISELIIPEGIEEVYISEMPNLTKVELPASVTHLSTCDISWCPNLTTVVFKGETELEEDAISDCPAYKA